MKQLWLGFLKVFVCNLARLGAWVQGLESRVLCKIDHRRISHLDPALNQFEEAHLVQVGSQSDPLIPF